MMILTKLIFLDKYFPSMKQAASLPFLLLKLSVFNQAPMR